MRSDIFKGDPFLLRPENQKRFGRELLRNVLTRRTAMAGTPNIIDLHAGDATPAKAAAPPPSADLAERYRDSRIQRKALSEADRDALMRITMVARGEKTERRLRDILDKDGNVEKKHFITHEKAVELMSQAPLPLNHRLRIAAVGFRVKISKLEDGAYLDEDLCLLKSPPGGPQKISGIPDDAGIPQLGRTTLAPDAKADRWTKTICGHISEAVESGCQLVLVPEFGLPPALKDVDLIGEIQKCCVPLKGEERQDHFVFAGSRHEGGCNRGPVLHLKQQKLPDEVKWHYKFASARGLRENILGPRTDAFSTYSADVTVAETNFTFNVTVAICYDTFDPSNFLSLVFNTAALKSYETEQIILVPSFNPSDEFIEYLRDLSFLTSSTVVYVNALHGDAKMYVAGFAISDLLDQSSEKVIKQIKDYMVEVQNERQQQQAKYKDLQKKDTKKANVARRRRDFFRERHTALSGLLNGVEALQKNGGLSHLLTVESCKHCDAGHGDDEYECGRDILYYNIDTRLLEVLQQFRNRYFDLDEGFLPEPFQSKALEDEVTKLMKRQARRSARG